jgi:hypothetical protein
MSSYSLARIARWGRRGLLWPSALEVAPRDTDEASIVGICRQTVGVGLQLVEQLAERWIRELLMRQPAQRRALSGACCCPARGHVGRLVPAQHGTGRTKIADLAQPVLEVLEHRLRRTNYA